MGVGVAPGEDGEALGLEHVEVGEGAPCLVRGRVRVCGWGWGG